MGTCHMLACDDRRVLFDLDKGPWAAVYGKIPFRVSGVHLTLMRKAWGEFFSAPFDESLHRRIRRWAMGHLVRRVDDTSESLQEALDRGYVVARSRLSEDPNLEGKIDALVRDMKQARDTLAEITKGTAYEQEWDQ